ncbi:hypothetical protein MLD38_006450 [Melastoma candidum]|uniref:Uncharacterized protein n=1 Tax=Melastoma candidum TaxID=119954 RepID=A0ACB9RMI5_9MYRT|nr:hypothetical protein MLD38_006450 [Melastoma candidum]
MKGRREIVTNVAVAVDRDKNSRFTLKYALEKCLIPRDEVIKLVHVKQRSAESGDAVHPVVPADTPESFIPFRCFCVCKKMQSEMVLLEDYDVATALVEYVRRHHIQALFLGAPSRGSFSWLFKKGDVPWMVMRLAPSFCNVYIIGKGEVVSARAATMWITPPILQPQQIQPRPPQYHQLQLPDLSGTSHDEVEDNLSMSSGRSSTDSDFLSFYESFETVGKLPVSDTNMTEDERGGHRNKFRTTSPRHSETVPPRGCE